MFFAAFINCLRGCFFFKEFVFCVTSQDVEYFTVCSLPLLMVNFLFVVCIDRLGMAQWSRRQGIDPRKGDQFT